MVGGRVSTAKVGGGTLAAARSDAEMIAEVLGAEEARCAGVLDSDRAAMEPLIGDDYTNQHSNGSTENKEQLLDRISSASHTTYTRGELFVRIYGEVAVMTGDMDTHFPSRDGNPGRVLGQVAIQVWVLRDGDWQLVAQQTANRPE